MNKTVKIKILLVEDDTNLGFVVQDNLKKAGYDVKLCIDGQMGLQTFLNEAFDLCLLDVMMPKKDGFSLAEDIRKQNAEVPIIFLTAKSMNEDKIKGFKIGGDDYITKPFNFDELVLRIEAILKRTRNKTNVNTKGDKDLFTIGKYDFDFRNQILTINNKKKLLTKKEADLLKLLCIHKNQVLAREIILNSIWGNDDYFSGRSMDVFITKLRKYLSEDSRIKIINIHGVGFKLLLEE
ncbi:MAG: response regulator transcription factor [Flavobacteriales bacterium]|nr:response regulator transcription factor [Flavobacteriales bacterium]